MGTKKTEVGLHLTSKSLRWQKLTANHISQPKPTPLVVYVNEPYLIMGSTHIWAFVREVYWKVSRNSEGVGGDQEGQKN